MVVRTERREALASRFYCAIGLAGRRGYGHPVLIYNGQKCENPAQGRVF